MCVWSFIFYVHYFIVEDKSTSSDASYIIGIIVTAVALVALVAGFIVTIIMSKK